MDCNPLKMVFFNPADYFAGMLLLISSRTALRAATSVFAVVSKLRVAPFCVGSLTAQ
jgi:hypothetical protein